ncbi:hypothetical protein A0H76_614 [Hepatospora eriocheir]|uniref:Cyclin N-terminal domain-containing protein n=1 Tax=Hepatospora eriocheir TaxID=1081669 RepID=A0A1X0Q7V3_9MICR|nr:hypothetical protein A0H76_614 [Hepatospora eriocheir]
MVDVKSIVQSMNSYKDLEKYINLSSVDVIMKVVKAHSLGQRICYTSILFYYEFKVSLKEETKELIVIFASIYLGGISSGIQTNQSSILSLVKKFLEIENDEFDEEKCLQQGNELIFNLTYELEFNIGPPKTYDIFKSIVEKYKINSKDAAVFQSIINDFAHYTIAVFLFTDEEIVYGALYIFCIINRSYVDSSLTYQIDVDKFIELFKSKFKIENYLFDGILFLSDILLDHYENNTSQ